MDNAPREIPVIRMAGKLLDFPRLFQGESGYRSMSSWLIRQRWFAGKSKKIIGGEFSDFFRFGERGDGFYFGGFLKLRYETGGEESYFIPLSFSRGASKTLFPLSLLEFDDVSGALEDALLIPEFGQILLRVFEGEEADKSVSVDKTPLFKAFVRSDDRDILPRVLSGEQSNTSLLFDRSLIMKCYRRPEKGGNCDFEMGMFFASRGMDLPVAPLLGAISHSSEGGGSMVLALLSGFVPNRGDGWSWLLKVIDPEKVKENFNAGKESLLGDDVSGVLLKMGEGTGAMHRSVSEGSFSPEMSPVAFAKEDWDSLGSSISSIENENFPKGAIEAPSWWPPLSISFEEAAGRFRERIQRIFSEPFSRTSNESWGMKVRCHGDYHLGQLLITNELDIVIIDFEGEPSVPISVRREKRSPMSDVAGMLRSFDYLSKMIFQGDENRILSKALFDELSHRFLSGYRQKMEGSGVLPTGEVFSSLLKVCLIRKAFYELSYEMNNRPAWCHVPLEGLLELLS